MDKLTLHGLSQFYIKLEENQKTRKLTDLMDILGVFFLPVPRSFSLHLPPSPLSFLHSSPVCPLSRPCLPPNFLLVPRCISSFTEIPTLPHFFRTSRCPVHPK